MTKTRFAPSPTGYLHVGGLRTALYNYLYAKKTGGKFVLRIEDTDQSRKVEGAVENLLQTFQRMGIPFDEGPDYGGDNGPYFQSQRLGIYKKYIAQLLDSGHAYPCFCSPERLDKVRQERSAQKLNTPYDRNCLSLDQETVSKKILSEPHVIRMKVPESEEISFYDIVRDKVTVHSNDIDDQILMKTDGFPTYHLANVVDDHLMEISHVIRGEEWLPSTSKHILLYRFLGWKPPKFAHLPLLLNPDKSKLSKRQGNVAVEDFLDKGYLAESLNNFVALLGWNPGTDRELFDLKALEKEFNIKRVQKSGAVFDYDKLGWMNGQYLKIFSADKLCKMAEPFFKSANLDVSDKRKFTAAVDYSRKRVDTLADLPGEVKMFYDDLCFDNESLIILSTDSAKTVCLFWAEAISKQNHWSDEDLKLLLIKTTEATGAKGKDLYFPLRLALYGNVHGPDMPTIFSLLDRDTIISRLNYIETIAGEHDE